MTTKHQAPEVTSELRHAIAAWAWDHVDEQTNRLKGEWLTELLTAVGRATQPQSLTIDEIRAALTPFAEACEQIDDAESDEEWAKFRLLIGDYRRAKALLDRLQSLSGEQIAENANCSGGLIDREATARAIEGLKWAMAGVTIADAVAFIVAAVRNDRVIPAALAAPKHGEVE